MNFGSLPYCLICLSRIDQARMCALSGKPPSVINPAQANQGIRQMKEICDMSKIIQYLVFLFHVTSNYDIYLQKLAKNIESLLITTTKIGVIHIKFNFTLHNYFLQQLGVSYLVP